MTDQYTLLLWKLSTLLVQTAVDVWLLVVQTSPVALLLVIVITLFLWVHQLKEFDHSSWHPIYFAFNCPLIWGQYPCQSITPLRLLLIPFCSLLLFYGPHLIKCVPGYSNSAYPVPAAVQLQEDGEKHKTSNWFVLKSWCPHRLLVLLGSSSILYFLSSFIHWLRQLFSIYSSPHGSINIFFCYQCQLMTLLPTSLRKLKALEFLKIPIIYVPTFQIYTQSRFSVFVESIKESTLVLWFTFWLHS